MRHSAIESFTKIAEDNGFIPKTKVIEIKECDAKGEVAQDLAGQLLNVVRVRYINDDPLVIENNFFPLPRFDGLRNLEPTDSLYDVFYSKYGINKLCSQRTTLSVVSSTAKQAGILKCSVGFPLFLLNTVVTDENGSIVQVAEDFILSNKYQFEL